ncbi:MAG: nucleotidyltransferase domain-containing protein [Pseudomonadota bacterium]
MTEPVCPAMRSNIQKVLNAIEEEDGVRILLAVESGSRAWGFHSPDSDYDVRFVYARPKDWHYRVGKKRDVIERPIDAELDVSGWELSKALQLALGSNAVVAEWLQSPILYRSLPGVIDQLTAFTERALSRKSVTWHYLSLLKRQQSRVLAPDGSLRVKRWFYILRPALALRWLRLNERAMPPMDLARLRAETDLSDPVSDAMDALLVRKMAAKEQATMTEVDPLLDNLVHSEWRAAEAWVASAGWQDRDELWAEATHLHMALSEAAFA